MHVLQKMCARFPIPMTLRMLFFRLGQQASSIVVSCATM